LRVALRTEGVKDISRVGFWLLPALVLAVFFSGGCRQAAARPDALVLKRSDGSTLELKGGADRVVLAFVSRRSPPCRSLLEELRSAAAALSGVNLVAAFVDRDPESPAPAVAGLEVVFDPEKSAAARYRVSVLPTVVVLDRQLSVVFREEGFSPRTAGRLAGALMAGGKQP